VITGKEVKLEANPKPRTEILDFDEEKGGTNEEKARIRYV
jgi:hypothetical protein